MSHLPVDVLNDFVDGEMAPAQAAAVQAHLASCAACRAEVQALRSVIARVRALPRSVAPPRDLRPRSRPAAARALPPGRGWLAAAAVLAIALASTLRGTGRDQAESAAPGVHAAAPVERRYQAVVAELSTLLQERRERLPAGVRTDIDRTLAEIDRTLDRSRQALRSAPGDVDAELGLSATYAQKIELLHQALELTTGE